MFHVNPLPRVNDFSICEMTRYAQKRLQLQIRRGFHTTISLALKAPITAAADDIHKYFFIVFRENKT